MSTIGITPRLDPLPAWSKLWNALHLSDMQGVTVWQRIYVKRCRNLPDYKQLNNCPHHWLDVEQNAELHALIVRARLMGKWDTDFPIPHLKPQPKRNT